MKYRQRLQAILHKMHYHAKLLTYKDYPPDRLKLISTSPLFASNTNVPFSFL